MNSISKFHTSNPSPISNRGLLISFGSPTQIRENPRDFSTYYKSRWCSSLPPSNGTVGELLYATVFKTAITQIPEESPRGDYSSILSVAAILHEVPWAIVKGNCPISLDLLLCNVPLVITEGRGVRF